MIKFFLHYFIYFIDLLSPSIPYALTAYYMYKYNIIHEVYGSNGSCTVPYRTNRVEIIV